MRPRMFQIVSTIACVAVWVSLAGAQKESGSSQGKNGQECVECHKGITPQIVTDWELSKHSENDVSCPSCHGHEHKSKDDVAKTELALPEKCIQCHEGRVQEFKSGKHALAWTAMKAMPTTHWQPMAQIEGLKGCGGCHRHGLKTEQEVRELREAGSAFGVASCDTCHTRHLFSADEARQPQACQTCHIGIDHPQWEMYSSSKHGIRALLKQVKVLPESAAAPTCQTCHMPGGHHGVKTAWGFLAVRLPMPEDPQWAADRAVVLQGLGVLDPAGKPTARLEAVKVADVARLSQEAWQQKRDEMLAICNKCHAASFSRAELEKGDQMIRASDRLMAEAIQVVAGLYKDGLLKKPESYAYPYPDLLAFHDAPTVIEQRLFKMFLEHRMRTFQGAFHNSPEYTLWLGWSEMQRDLTEIKEMALLMRERAPIARKEAEPAKPALEKKPAAAPKKR